MARPTIHLIDTGIAPAAVGWLSNRCVSIAAGKNWIEQDQYPYDDTGHGTGISSIISSEYGRLAVPENKCTVFVHKVEHTGSLGKQATWANAMTQIARCSTEHSILLAPLGSWCKSPAVYEAIKACLQADIVVVSIAHNDNRNTSRYPGRYASDFPNVLCVGALDSRNARLQWGASGRGSNYGPEVSIYALGENCPIFDHFGDKSLASGTSAASARVAALVAAMRAREPHMSAPEICDAILALTIADVELPDGNYGKRLLNYS